MKTNEFPSHHFISKKALWWLKQRMKVDAWVLDVGAKTKFDLDSSEQIDVLLLGNFLYEILLFRFWPEKKYRFWVLSRAARNTLVNLIGIPSKYIGIIPRDQILSSSPITKKIPNPKKVPINFVYAGRISRSKNILLLIHVVNHLQHITQQAHQLFLFGNFDGYGVEDRGTPEVSSIKVTRMIMKEIASLNWLVKPRIFENLEANEWQSKVPKDSVGISLSLHMKEDFGLALAELENLGFPRIVSQWGGHLDQNNSALIPIGLISHPMDSRQERIRSAKKIAGLLLKPEKLKTSSLPNKAFQNPNPIYASAKMIRARQQMHLKKFDGVFKCWTYLDLASFSKTKIGKKLFQQYRNYFSSIKSSI